MAAAVTCRPCSAGSPDEHRGKAAGVPTELAQELDDLPVGAVVLNAYELGGWLRWKHSDLEPVVDGMSEAYSVQHLRDYGRVQAVAAGWETTFDEWNPAAALVLERSPLATALTDQRGWTEVATSEGYVLLEPAQ